MANEENLKPFTSDQSREEAAKNGRKGGIASGVSKRRKKTMREVAEFLANQPVTNNAIKKSVKAFAAGVDEDDIDLQLAVTMGLFQAAIKGNVAAYQEIAKTLGNGIDDMEVEDDLSRSLREYAEGNRDTMEP